MAAHPKTPIIIFPPMGARRKQPRHHHVPAISFCVSWNRVFLLLSVFYALLFASVLLFLEQQNNNNYFRNPRSGDAKNGGGAMHDMLRSVFLNTTASSSSSSSSWEGKIKEAGFRTVGGVLDTIEHELAAAGVVVATASRHQQQNSPPAPAMARVEDSYALLLRKYEDHLNQQSDEEADSHRRPLLRSCRWRQEGPSSEGYYSLDDTCRTTSLSSSASSFTYYNPHQRQSRWVCGQEIRPGSVLVLTKPCLEPPRLFPVVPDRTGRGLPAVTTGFDKPKDPNDPNYRSTGDEFADCDIPCRSRGSPGVVCTRYVDGTDWSFTFSMEGPKYYASLQIDPNAYKTNRFYSTTSYESDVPLPYYSRAEYDIQAPGLKYDGAIRGAVFLARNCASQNDRESIIRKLQQSNIVRVDSLSSCLRNADPPLGVDLSNKKSVMSKYLFYLAFENQNVDDYITEKLWGPLEAGTVPVYYGAPNVKDHVPNRSIIAVSDFDSVEALAVYLKEVASNKTLYESYQAWRTQPLPPHFRARYDFTTVHSTCRTCRWAHARLYGLGWDHRNQSLRDLRLDRTACIDPGSRRLLKPVAEVWSTSGFAENGARSAIASSSCQAVGDGNRNLMVDSGLERVIWEKDGVIDLLIHGVLSKDGSYALDFVSPLADSHLLRIEPGHVRIQTVETRITVLTWPREALDNGVVQEEDAPGTLGSVRVSVKADRIPLRLRIIVEDVDALRRGADQVENYFGSRILDDFYNPVEVFVAAQ